jgi:hypothetical protein
MDASAKDMLLGKAKKDELPTVVKMEAKETTVSASNPIVVV